MKNGQVKITGIKRNEKDGKVSFTLYGLTPFEEYEQNEGTFGLKTIQEWTNKVDLSMLKIDDIVTLSYAKGFQNMAVLNNVTVVTPAK